MPEAILQLWAHSSWYIQLTPMWSQENSADQTALGELTAFTSVPCCRRWIHSTLSCLSLALILWAIAPILASCETSEEQLADHFRAGQQALKQGEFARAAEEFKKVLALDPNLIEAEVNLGLAYHSLFEYDLAVRHLATALRERPNLLAPNVIVGMDYLKLGSPEKAVPFLQRALKLDPSSREARQALASSYLVQENFGNAAEQFRQLALLNSDKAEAWFKLGHQYLDLSARLAYRGAHLYRESAWGHRFLGDLLFQRSRWEDAAQEYRKALGSEPRQPGLHASLGQACLHASKLEQAETEFHSELQLDSKNEVAWLGLAETQLAKGEASMAAKAVGKVWEISPEFLAVQRDFPMIELSQDQATALVGSLQAFPEGAAKHFLLASLDASREITHPDDRWKGFQSDFRKWQHAPKALSANQDPCNAHRYAACADSLQSQKHLADSQRLLLGKTLFALREYQRAAEALAKVRGVTKENAEASYWLARTYHELGAQSYAQLEESFPDSWRAHQLRGEGHALRQDLDNAAKEFQVALKLRPEDSELHEALGELYLDNHSDEDALRELDRSLALDPSRTHTLYLLGRLYVQKRQNEKAVPHLQQALRLQPDLTEARGLLGTAYVRLGQFTEAVPQLEKAAPFDHYGNVHYQLYLAYRKLGQSELAQKALTRSQNLRRSSLEHDQALIMGSPQVDSDPQ